MSRPTDHSHSVRKVVLPSGKTIEVVYFEDQLVSGLTKAPVRREADHGIDRDLHHCSSCSSELVFPLEWSEAGAKHWEITLRCPNCEWTDTGIFSSDSVERFDTELDHGTESIIADLRRLMHANMEEDVERFSLALRDGHVLPEDF
jgi:hypothetical protein